MTHLKTLASPKAMKVHRKENVFVMKAAPGPYKASEAVPIGVLLRDYLGLAANRKEVRYILHNNEVIVNGRRVKDERFPLGLLDVVSIPASGKHYLIKVDSNARLYPEEISEEKSKTKLCKLVDKTVVKGGKLQLNLYGGGNILADVKDSKKYPVGGTLVLKLPEMKIAGFIELAEGKTALVAWGRHAGKVGKVAGITKSGLNLKSLTTIESEGEKLQTNTDYIFIVGDKEPKI